METLSVEEKTGVRDPRGGVRDTLKRGEEKIKLALEWIASFHFTTLPVLAKRLGINENTAFRFVKKLKQRGLIKEFDSFVIRRELLMLTPSGLILCTELCERLFAYSTEPSKVNLNRVRHDLQVQIAVAERLGPDDTFLTERYIKLDSNRKIPDALIETATGETLVIEVELTPKKDERIYIAFECHIKALHEKPRHRVEYIFKTAAMQAYYLKRFEAEGWPVYNWSQSQGRWVLREGDVYYPRDDSDVIKRFLFSSVSTEHF